MAGVKASHVFVASALLALPSLAGEAASGYVGSPEGPGDYVGLPSPPEGPGDYVGLPSSPEGPSDYVGLPGSPEGPSDYVGDLREAPGRRGDEAETDLELLSAVPSPIEDEPPPPSLPVSPGDVAGLAGLAGAGIAGAAWRRSTLRRHSGYGRLSK